MVLFVTSSCDPVAQWIRALPCGGRGRAFESPQGRQATEGRSRRSASGRPSGVTAVREPPTTSRGGDRAVERARLENELGLKTHVGSNPTLPANRLKTCAIRRLRAADAPLTEGTSGVSQEANGCTL